MFENASWPRLSLLALVSVLACSAEPTESTDEPLGEARTGLVAVPKVAAPGAASFVFPPTFELTNVWYDDAASGRVKFLSHNGDNFFWEELYDVHPASFNLVWTLKANLTAGMLPGLLNGQGLNLTLSLGPKTLFRGTDLTNGDYFTKLTASAAASPKDGCALGKQCLTTTIVGSVVSKFPSTAELALSYTSVTFGIPNNTSTGKVSAFINKPSLFANKIEPIFRSERCVHCHSFGTPEALYEHHENLFAGYGFEGVLVATDHGHRLECAGSCHDVSASVPGRTFAETKWMAPMKDMNIDWRTKTGPQICQTIKQHLPTVAAMKEHFFEDGRIAWAVNDAVAPANIHLSRAQPGNYSDFEETMRAWILGGMPCPQ
ncbi:MAG: hypothetical protein EOO73_13770 [Myxococcales bacterium]|nr:MAG: hypothetical protein EOO73_13770 [Myxococcales bacterium]